MLKVDAITFFGSKTKLANAAGVRLASVAAWGIQALKEIGIKAGFSAFAEE